ncbi:MAG: hypothetical protein AAFP70_04715, partial [Calditrichota bacterium]
MSRILLIPGENGSGQLARSLFLGERLRAHGHSIGIAVDKKYAASAVKHQFTVFSIRSWLDRFVRLQLQKPYFPNTRLKSRRIRRPYFLEFDGVPFRVPSEGYLSEKIVYYRMSKYSEIIRRFKPDVLIGDGHYLTSLLGKKYGLKVLQISRLPEFAPAPEFFWWKSSDTRLVSPNSLGPFRRLLEELRISDMHKPEDLLRGDAYLIPANEVIEPVDTVENEVFFTGPLNPIDMNPTHGDAIFPNTKIPKVFVSLGSNLPASHEKMFYSIITEAFRGRQYELIVTSRRSRLRRRFNKEAKNITFVNGVSQKRAIRQSDMVIYSGSYSTTMRALLESRPALVIPTHSAHEGYGRRLERLGVGK